MTRTRTTVLVASLLMMLPETASAADFIVEYSGNSYDLNSGDYLSPLTITTTFNPDIASVYASGNFADVSYKQYYGTDSLILKSGLDTITVLPYQYIFSIENASDASQRPDAFTLSPFFLFTGFVGTRSELPATTLNSVGFPAPNFSAPVLGSYFNGTNTYGIRGTVTISASAVPEPATWAMMILGFAAIGGAMRARKRQQVEVRFAI